jgi:hypothetical protein
VLRQHASTYTGASHVKVRANESAGCCHESRFPCNGNLNLSPNPEACQHSQHLALKQHLDKFMQVGWLGRGSHVSLA